MRKLLLAFCIVSAATLLSSVPQARADAIFCPSDLTSSNLATAHSSCYESCRKEKSDRQKGCRDSCDQSDRFCADKAKQQANQKAKVAADKAAKETQEKQEKAARESKEAAEKATKEKKDKYQKDALACARPYTDCINKCNKNATCESTCNKGPTFERYDSCQKALGPPPK
jgi:hypothetical protein